MSTGDTISIREKVGYSLGDAASQIVFDSSVAILAYFYTDIYGLPPAVMGTMFLLVRLLDAITNPIMGRLLMQPPRAGDSFAHGYWRFACPLPSAAFWFIRPLIFPTAEKWLMRWRHISS